MFFGLFYPYLNQTHIRYGFTEVQLTVLIEKPNCLTDYLLIQAGFNFQNNNFGKGALGNDRVTISVQDSAGTNNADFSTPPE